MGELCRLNDSKETPADNKQEPQQQQQQQQQQHIRLSQSGSVFQFFLNQSQSTQTKANHIDIALLDYGQSNHAIYIF